MSGEQFLKIICDQLQQENKLLYDSKIKQRINDLSAFEFEYIIKNKRFPNKPEANNLTENSAIQA